MENNSSWSFGEKKVTLSTHNDLILDLKNVNVKFKVEDDTLHILRDVSLSLPRGSFLCVVGESGCGKSVTAQAIVQLLPDNGQISSGKIEFTTDNQVVELNTLEKYGKQMRDIRGGKIGMIFQEFALIERLSVLTNVLVGRLAYVPSAPSILVSLRTASPAMPPGAGL